MNFHNDDGTEKRYRLANYKIGAPLTIQSANQLQDMAKRLNEGVKNIEVSAISPEIAGTIPEEHFREMKRLSDQTDSKVSVHAPIIDAAGFDSKEGKWTEQNRINNEQEFNSIIERANLLGPNTPVVIHGANMFGQDWDKETEKQYKEEIEKEEKYLELLKKKKEIIEGIKGKPSLLEKQYKKLPEEIRKEKTKEEFISEEEEDIKKGIERLEERRKKVSPRVLAVVNEETGQVAPLEFERKQKFIGDEQVWDPYTRLDSLNESEWDKNKLDVMSNIKELKDLERKKDINLEEAQALDELNRKNLLKEHEKAKLGGMRHNVSMIDAHISQINQHINTAVEDIHHRLIKFRNEDKEIERFLEGESIEGKNYKKAQEELKKLNKMRRVKITDEEYLSEKVKIISQVMTMMPTPKIWKPVNEFSIKQASKTFSNLAYKAYDKEKEKAPIIAIENSYPNMPLSRAKELKQAIKESRKEFVKQLIEKKKIKKSKAKEIANKLIGATWDVGHINLLRKAGYSEEDILEEAKKIAKDVKHVHLTDNFGLNDTHLPPGMGNVPIKETLKILEEKGDMANVRHIVEAGNFVQHFKQSPHPQTLEHLGSPLYKFGDTPYWNELQEKNLTPAGEYFMGMGDVLPELHHKKLYGAGFSGLPPELGGGGGSSERGRFAEGEQ